LIGITARNMRSIKNDIIKNLCYTELVYSRINRKLGTNFSKEKIEEYILEILKRTNKNSISKTGKNYYVSNSEKTIRITINSTTFRIITVDKITCSP
jgi:hypothetical protein